MYSSYFHLLLLEKVRPCSPHGIPVEVSLTHSDGIELRDARLPSKSPMYVVPMMSLIMMSDNYMGWTHTG